MSSVGEKLVESWLDSQSERRYQSAFIQLLVSEGWRVLHNTRHSPIEFGKDVIARDPTGTLYAIQLKGNPGSRLTKSQAQAMLSQVGELVDVPVAEAYKHRPDERHIGAIVTNGEIDEEALLLFEQFGKRTENPVSPCKQLRVWARGDLLSRFREKLSSVWPTSLEGMRGILEIYASKGSELPSTEMFSTILRSAVPKITSSSGTAEKTAGLTSALLLGELLKFPWIESSNHYACFKINIILSMYLSRYADNTTRSALLREYDRIALEHATDLLREAEESGLEPTEIWLGGSPLEELDIMRERVRLLADCAAALLLSKTELSQYPYALGLKCIQNSFGKGTLWGHAAVPPMIVRYMAWRNHDATPAPDHVLSVLIRALPFAASHARTGLPAPYYNFEECLFLHTDGLIGTESSLTDDNTKGRAWFAIAVLYMLAKRNWKATCKAAWHSLSKLQHEEFDLDPSDFIDAGLTKRGRIVTKQYYAATWPDVVEMAVKVGDGALPKKFSERAWVVAAFVSLVPYRAWTNIILWLDTELCRTWYDKDHPKPTN